MKVDEDEAPDGYLAVFQPIDKVCEGCYFSRAGSCRRVPYPFDDSCVSSRREDGQNVIFVERGSDQNED
jgi:hypothetical protein